METHMNPNPKRAALGLLAILAAGCPPCGLIPCIDELPPREDVEEVEEPAPCLSLVNEVFPEPGDAAVYYRSSVTPCWPTFSTKSPGPSGRPFIA
jgi:hypothetical protein